MVFDHPVTLLCICYSCFLLHWFSRPAIKAMKNIAAAAERTNEPKHQNPLKNEFGRCVWTKAIKTIEAIPSNNGRSGRSARNIQNCSQPMMPITTPPAKPTRPRETQNPETSGNFSQVSNAASQHTTAITIPATNNSLCRTCGSCIFSSAARSPARISFGRTPQSPELF